MLWDVLIVAGIAFTQLVITWYGVHVSVVEHRIKNAIIIGVIGGTGLVLTVYGAIRSGKAQSALQAQLNQIQRNTERPPIVNVNPPTIHFPDQPPHHSRMDFVAPIPVPGEPLIPYHKGQRPALNMGDRNVGDFVIFNSQSDAKILIVPVDKVSTVFKDNRKSLKPQFASGTLNPHVPGFSYRTYFGSPLSEDDVAKLNANLEGICMIGITIWSDESGKYETDMCQCWGMGDSDWHRFGENNRERKLHQVL